MDIIGFVGESRDGLEAQGVEVGDTFNIEDEIFEVTGFVEEEEGTYAIVRSFGLSPELASWASELLSNETGQSLL